MIRRHTDLAAFRALAEPLLGADEVVNNLPLGLLAQLQPSPELLLVDVGGAGVAMRLPPFNLIVSALPPAAIDGLVDWLVAERIEVPGVVGPGDAAAAVADKLAARGGRRAWLAHAMRVFENRRLVAPRAPADGGSARAAAASDLDRVLEWVAAFDRDVGNAVAAPRALVEERLARGDFWLWQTDRAVAMAGVARRTPGTTVVAYVYTPPALRGRGYASAVVAALTAAIHAQGKIACLFADRANPTSNKIYEAIGYAPVALADEWRLS